MFLKPIIIAKRAVTRHDTCAVVVMAVKMSSTSTEASILDTFTKRLLFFVWQQFLRSSMDIIPLVINDLMG